MAEGEKIFGQAVFDAVRQMIKEEFREAFKSAEPKPPKLLYTTEEAAKMLSVPSTWLAARAREGKIRTVKMGHYVNFKLEELSRFASEGLPPPACATADRPKEPETGGEKQHDKKNESGNIRGLPQN